MKTYHKVISFNTKSYLQFTDITEEIKKAVTEGGIKNGIVNIQSKHTTAMLILNENEPLLIDDMREHLEKISPITDEYKHDNFEIRTVNMCEDECANGHSHCKALHFPSNVTLNIAEKNIQFGVWQRVLFVELDRPRPRKIDIMVMGE